MAAWPQSAETTGVGWAPGGVLTLQAESWCHDASVEINGWTEWYLLQRPAFWPAGRWSR